MERGPWSYKSGCMKEIGILVKPQEQKMEDKGYGKIVCLAIFKDKWFSQTDVWYRSFARHEGNSSKALMKLALTMCNSNMLMCNYFLIDKDFTLIIINITLYHCSVEND